MSNCRGHCYVPTGAGTWKRAIDCECDSLRPCPECKVGLQPLWAYEHYGPKCLMCLHFPNLRPCASWWLCETYVERDGPDQCASCRAEDRKFQILPEPGVCPVCQETRELVKYPQCTHGLCKACYRGPALPMDEPEADQFGCEGDEDEWEERSPDWALFFAHVHAHWKLLADQHQKMLRATRDRCCVCRR